MQARDVLSNGDKRMAYDAELRAAESGMYAESESWAGSPRAWERSSSSGGSASIFKVHFQASAIILMLHLQHL